MTKDVEDVVAEIAKEIFLLDDAPHLDAPLVSIDGWDSLALLDLVDALNARFGVLLTDSDVREVTTLRGLADRMKGR